MKTIKELPDFNWSSTALKHIELSGPELFEQSDSAFALGNYAAVGLIYYSLLSPPWLWFLLAEGVGMRELIDMRRKQELIPLGARTAVEADEEVALRFAEFFGFVPTGETVLYYGADYIIMEKQ